jgi:hypothetical protein
VPCFAAGVVCSNPDAHVSFGARSYSQTLLTAKFASFSLFESLHLPLLAWFNR